MVSTDRIRRTDDDRSVGVVARGQDRCFTVVEAMDHDAVGTRWTLTMLVELTRTAESSASLGTERTIGTEFGIDAQTTDRFDGTVERSALARVRYRRAFVQLGMKARTVAWRMNGLLEFDAKLKSAGGEERLMRMQTTVPECDGRLLEVGATQG